jgi:hypothetical protein
MTQVKKEEAPLPGATSSPATVYRSDYAVQPVTPSVLFDQPIPLAAFLRTRLGRIAALSAGGALAIGVLVGSLGLAPLLAARAAKQSATMVATRVELLPSPSCLRDSSQIIKSEARDAMLLDAVKAHDAGNPELALQILRKYTAEACDRATLEAVEFLERQNKTAKKDP